MPEITVALLRKRAEHNEGVLATLEELSLHQEELEHINELLGATCRHLKILYLQNNIIGKMENLHHMKDLGYLNLALNNITRIEGLKNCEFLHKLDLTMNFIDVDELQASMEHLQSREHLVDLYMMGNPSQVTWPNFQNYVIAMLPQLQTLDGTEITKSMRIVAKQNLAKYQAELESLAVAKREEKRLKKLEADTKAAEKASPAEAVYEVGPDGFDLSKPAEEPSNRDEELTENTPEARIEIYRELAQQKKAKEDAQAANLPRERNFEKEQESSIAEVRQKEEQTDHREIKQKNEGNWEFFWDEDSTPGAVVLEVMLPKHLDSSLIDVDVHPTYVSMVIKSKLLRLRLPVEVMSSDSKCQRSKITGSLKIIMPKLNHRDTIGMVSKDQMKSMYKAAKQPDASAASRSRVTIKGTKKPSLQEEMMAAAREAGSAETLTGEGTTMASAVDFRNIVKRRPEDATIASVSPVGNAPQKALVTELD